MLRLSSSDVLSSFWNQRFSSPSFFALHFLSVCIRTWDKTQAMRCLYNSMTHCYTHSFTCAQCVWKQWCVSAWTGCMYWIWSVCVLMHCNAFMCLYCLSRVKDCADGAPTEVILPSLFKAAQWWWHSAVPLQYMINIIYLIKIGITWFEHELSKDLRIFHWLITI